MDYEQKYKDALERAKQAMKDGTITNTAIAYLQNIFPELAESEDERIRKELIDFVKSRLAGFPQCEKFIAWLEKQSHDGKKWIYEDEYYKEKEQLYQDGVDDVLENPHKYGLEKQNEPKPQGKTALGAIKEEKVDNQNCVKPVDEIGQKFKVGDIVQYITDSADRRKIEEIDTLCNMYHTDSSPIMFEVEDEWKVVGNTEMIEALRTEYEKGRADALSEMKSSWSEEDKEMLNLIIEIFEVNHPNGYFKANELNDPNMKAVYTEEIVTWLKILKQRYNWEPSKEQMDALDYYANSLCTYCDRQDDLRSLFNVIKKL